jgi:S1-C subfamily serine protease
LSLTARGERDRAYVIGGWKTSQPGGALVNLSGRVIGIPTLAALDPQMGASEAPGIGFAIDSNTVRRVAGALARSR